MKSWMAALSLAVAGLGFVAVPMEADAKRLGGGKASGMQRQAPAKPADTSPPATQNTPAQSAATPAAGAAAAAPAAAAAGKRSWMGPIAGLAAGLGIAALLSHFGLGEAFADFMMLALLAVAAIFLVRFLMRRFAGNGAASPRLAGAGAPAPRDMMMRQSTPASGASDASAVTPSAPATTTQPARASAPQDFDAAAFERIAKMIFVRLQAANDEGNVEDLRKFTTPELFASLRVDLQERGGVAQKTDVVQLDAKVVDTAQEPDQWVVSVRFSGLIREASESGAEPFEELWHLVRPVDGSRDWAIAGITPISG